MESHINDFIALHQHSSEVQVHSLVCKSSSCRIEVLTTNEGIWKTIIAEMRKQEWWNFTETKSSSIPSGDTGVTIFVFLFV